jgi:5-methylthioadenosine/S-adenosylhomocysteine deaminase
MSSVRWLDQLGVLGSNVLAAHCVAVSDGDIRVLRQRDVAVAHNPTSNAKLASGIAPVLKMLDAGVRVGLGTDSNLSNNRLDMFAEMKMAALLQRLESNDASTLTCGRALRLATIDGARCLGLEADVGSLEVGKKADVILVDLEQPHFWPLLSGDQGNVVPQLVYAASSGDVTTAIVDGKVLMRDRCVLTLDEDAAQDLVSSAARDLIGRVAASRRLDCAAA